MKEKIIVICYGEKEIWDDRKKALKFYLEAMNACEGSERERYRNVYYDLSAGLNICRDH